MRNALVAVLVLVSTACATVQQRATKPLATDGSKPVQFGALGASYEVPPRLNIVDHDRAPGLAWLDFVDQNTGCKGGLAFVATTNKNAVAHQRERALKSAGEFKQRGVDFKLVDRTQPMLGDKAQVTVTELTTRTDTAAEVHFALFVGEQQLLVAGTMYCNDPGFVDPQLQVLAYVVDSQKRVDGQKR